MEPIQKKLIGWAVLALIIVGGVFLIVLTNQTLNTATTTNTVSFSGTGSVVGLPDVAIISLSIVTEAATSEAAQDENSAKSQTLVSFLESEGIEERDIKTSGYNVRPVYTYPRDGQPTITGYQVSQSFEVKVRDLDNVDTVLDGVVNAGANQIGNLQLTIDDPDALKEEARAKAIADAREKAQNLEQQLGIRLGRIVNFNESGMGEPIMFRAESAAMPLGIGGGGPAVPVGENEVEVTVTITWQIR
jgi:uncharacterized protein YggE